MIEATLERWHALLRGELPGGVDELLADDVVFYSPVVFRPVRGRELVRLYLAGASKLFGGAGVDGSGPLVDPERFRYTVEIASGRHAALQFEVDVDGVFVNGVDLITCDDAGRISEFRVMIRPLRAIGVVQARMKALLEEMGALAAPG